MNSWRWRFVDPVWGWSIGFANNDYLEIEDWKHLFWRFWWRRI